MVSEQMGPEGRTTQAMREGGVARDHLSIKWSMFATIKPMPDSGIISAAHRTDCLSLIAIWNEAWDN